MSARIDKITVTLNITREFEERPNDVPDTVTFSFEPVTHEEPFVLAVMQAWQENSERQLAELRKQGLGPGVGVL